MQFEYKEVYFNEYCKKCKYFRTSESEDPCYECLAVPVNSFSHKPVKFKEGNTDEDGTAKKGRNKFTRKVQAGGDDKNAS